MANLKNKVAIITGSTSGIGAAMARRLALEGAIVIINSRSSVKAGEKLASELPNAFYIQADVADEKQCQRLIKETINKFQRLDILINNAVAPVKIIPHQEIYEVEDELFQENFNINVMGAWYCARSALEYLKQSEDGNIINISSIAGLIPRGSSIPYAISKAALNHLTLILAKIAAPKVRVNAVAPGLIITPRIKQHTSEEFQEGYIKNAPLKKPGTPEDIAELILGIINTKNLTGQILVADSGFCLG